MADARLPVGDDGFRESIVKEAVAAVDWKALQDHLEVVTLARGHISEVCGHLRRHSDLICKYPDKNFEQRRARFLELFRNFALKRFGPEAAAEVAKEAALLTQIERGYRGILDVLGKGEIGRKPATVRASGSISRACHDFQDLMRRRDKTLSERGDLTITADIWLPDDNGEPILADSVLDGLSHAVAMTLIMEAHKNAWFADGVVVLPDYPAVGDEERSQSALTQALALYWRQWQRVEKRRRFLDGDLVEYRGDERPVGLPNEISALIEYRPTENGLSEREVYDYLANIRLRDRLFQLYMDVEIATNDSGHVVGIANGAELLPAQAVSTEELHAVVALSELLGYPIVQDDERPAGLRLLEWVRGYVVLKEIAKTRAKRKGMSGDDLAIVLSEEKLIRTLQACGLKGEAAELFVLQTCLHRSSRDMFDCPLVRVASSKYLLFGPGVIDLNVSMAILSNLSNRGEVLSKKGKSFERSVHRFFRSHKLKVFAFRVRRDGEEFEYDALVPWGEYLFLFECKNRSLSANDPTRAYYFDLEVKSQVKQVRRLADFLNTCSDVIKQKMRSQYVGMRIVPCILHPMPYSRIGDVDGVYFTDASALRRFFEQRYLNVRVPHRIGSETLLHRIPVRSFWKGDMPTAEDFLEILRSPFQLDLLMKHLEGRALYFRVSDAELVRTREIVQTERTTHSVCKAVGVDAESVLQEISDMTENVRAVRSTLEGEPR